MYKLIFSVLLAIMPCVSFAATVTPTKIHALPSKTTPIAADELMIEDSENSWKSRKVFLGSFPISTATQTVLDLKAAASCFANATAMTACFPSLSVGGDNLGSATAANISSLFSGTGDCLRADGTKGACGGISSWTDISTLLTGTGDYVKADGTTGDPTGTLPTGTEGQTIQYGSDGQAIAVDNAPLAFTDNVSRNATTGVVSVPVTATATSGSAVPFTSGGAYAALGGKEDADSTIIKVSEIDTQAEFEALLGWAIPTGSGSFAFDTFPTYEDSPHSSGIAINGTTLAVYSSTAGKWLTVGLTDSLNATPVTYSLTITPSGFTGADKFTYNSTDYTTEQTITGLTADASFTVTHDTGRTISCTGTGLTDNTGGSYTANTDTANVVSTCTSTAGLSEYLDTFDNADENPIVGWTSLTGKAAIKSVSGKALSSTGADAGALYTSGTLTADQYSSITVGTFATYIGVGVRFSSSANTGYLAQATGATKIRLYRNVAGAQTDLSGAGYTTATIVSGDVIRVEATGTSPVHLVVKLNGTTIGTVDDSTAPIATGSPVIYATGATGSIDSWIGGDL